MAGSHQQHDESPQTGGADALRDAVERTFRDAAGALQRLTGPQADPGTAATVAELTARIEELTARVERLEAKTKSKPKKTS